MTTLNKYLFITLCVIALTFAYYGYNNEWIIFNLPSKRLPSSVLQQPIIQKKPVTLHFWHNNRWYKESVDLIWSDDVVQNSSYLISSWLTLLDEEQKSDVKVSLVDVAITTSGTTALVCLSHSPFNDEDATYAKLMWLEGLLKTVREQIPTVQYLQFLVHHQPMRDYHLDFSHPWPVVGFI